MLLKTLISGIEKAAPLFCQAEWDNSGLQVAAARQEVTHLAVFLDPLPFNIAHALSLGADFMLSHHPLCIKPQMPDKINNYHEALRLLLSANAGLYAAHTSLDANAQGPAGWLAKELGLTDLTYLENIRHCENAGFGGCGFLPAPLKSAEFIKLAMNLLDIDHAVFCGPPLPETIEKIAFCGGSGSQLMENAHKQGAQIYITGDVKYHAALDAPLPVMDIGHHSYEEKMMRLFAGELQKMFDGISVTFISSHSPFRMICRSI